MFGQSELKQKQADQEGKIRQLEQTEADKLGVVRLNHQWEI